MTSSMSEFNRDSRWPVAPHPPLLRRRRWSRARCSRVAPHQIPHPDEVVRREREAKRPSDAALAPMSRLSKLSDRLHPAEDFFDSLPLSLADSVSGVARCAAVNRAASYLCRDVRRDSKISQSVYEVFGVVPFVAADRHTARSCDRLSHRDTCLALASTRGFGQSRVDHEAMPIVDHHVTRVAQLGFHTPRLPEKSNFGIGCRLVRLVCALLTVEIDRRIAWIIGLVVDGVLRLEALLTRPRLDERAVNREVLVRQQACFAGQELHPFEELVLDRGVDQTLPVLTEGRWAPDRIVRVQTNEPAE